MSRCCAILSVGAAQTRAQKRWEEAELKEDLYTDEESNAVITGMDMEEGSDFQSTASQQEDLETSVSMPDLMDLSNDLFITDTSMRLIKAQRREGRQAGAIIELSM